MAAQVLLDPLGHLESPGYLDRREGLEPPEVLENLDTPDRLENL